MRGLHFSFSKALVTTTALAFISVFCFSSVAFAVKSDEDKTRVVSAVPSFKDSSDTDFYQLCSNPAQLDALFQRDFYSPISLTSLHLKSPSHYYALVHFVQEILLPKALKQKSWFEISKSREWWEGMISQAFPKKSPQGNYLLGLVYEAFRLNQEALDAYKKASDANHVKAQSKVTELLYEGMLGQGRRSKQERSKQERSKELQTRAAGGDQYAQEMMNKALYARILGRERPGEKLFVEFKERAAGGDKDAQERVNSAWYTGHLGQIEYPGQDRLAELKARAVRGDQHAQSLINLAWYTGHLGLDEYPEEERLEKLKASAAEGDQNAQEMVYKAWYHGRLGQDKRSKKERYKELKLHASQGDKIAKRYLIKALFFGRLGQDKRSKQERYKELKLHAFQGDQIAKRYVIEALFFGNLGQYKRSERKRSKELILHIKRDLDISLKTLEHIPSNFIFPILKSLREGE